MFRRVTVPIGILFAIRRASQSITQPRFYERNVQGRYQAVPSEFQKFHPFGASAKSHAGHAVKESLFLYATRICGNQFRVFLEHHHMEIAERFDQAASTRDLSEKTNLRENFAAAGMDRQHYGKFSRDGRQSLDNH